jgi:hypothetical protein
MHDGCSGSFEDGKQSVDKLRSMGFSSGAMPVPVEITCECGEKIYMDTFEVKCPKCSMVYGVTPCHAFDASNIMPAGKDY